MTRHIAEQASAKDAVEYSRRKEFGKNVGCEECGCTGREIVNELMFGIIS